LLGVPALFLPKAPHSLALRIAVPDREAMRSIDLRTKNSSTIRIAAFSRNMRRLRKRRAFPQAGSGSL